MFIMLLYFSLHVLLYQNINYSTFNMPSVFTHLTVFCGYNIIIVMLYFS